MAFPISTSSGSTDSPVTSSKSNSCDETEVFHNQSVSDMTSLTASGKKKRKSYYIRKYPLPKLLKRDVRWDIPKMVTNVLNSRDDNLVNSFFHRICFPTCTFTDVVPKILGASSEIVYDIDTMIGIINVDLSVFPDLVMDLKHAQIVQHERFNGGSQIVLHYEMKGTKIYENHCGHTQICGSTELLRGINDDIVVLPNVFPVPADDITEIITPSATPSVVHHVDYKIENYIPLPQPVMVQMSPKISITLNEQNVAYAIEYSLRPGSEIIKTTLESSFQQLVVA